jgi:FtsP/CotA-like multicopper oxidase with cupredoxin domain
MDVKSLLSRRNFLKMGTLSTLGAAGAAALFRQPRAVAQTPQPPSSPYGAVMQHGEHGLHMPTLDGEVDHRANGFDPATLLTDFDYGTVSTLPNGQTLHEYNFFAADKTIEVAPGINFPAWTYNGRVPGPFIRVREGDRVRINFVNASPHSHTMHFHGIHAANLDGVYEVVPTGGRFVYEFDAEPFGLHLYHCHIAPLAKHIAKGLYGVFIIDPREGWPNKADHEFVMVLNGIDIDFDGANDFYAVNTIPFYYDKHPIKIKVGELVRVFLVNILEYDPVNSFHIHANFFHYYPTGTSLTPSEYTDTVIQGQGQRGILEFRYKYPGKYMFHAHKTEFAELGWTGVFEVEA